MGVPIQAYVALGSNLGERELHLYQARFALEVTAGIEVVSASRIYETEPVGPEGQGPYLNAVLGLQTELPPRALLSQLLEIERQQGRRRGAETERWSARTLDLDLLLYADECLEEEGLELPHPRLHQRAFVLEPLCELAGHRVHPRLAETLETLRARLTDPGAWRIWPQMSPDWRVPAPPEGAHSESRQ